MTYQTVRYEVKGPLCHIVLNRPEKLNAANDQLVEEVNEALFASDADPALQAARPGLLLGRRRPAAPAPDAREAAAAGRLAGRRSRESGLAADSVGHRRGQVGRGQRDGGRGVGDDGRQSHRQEGGEGDEGRAADDGGDAATGQSRADQRGRG
jgi:hypothetical protein